MEEEEAHPPLQGGLPQIGHVHQILICVWSPLVVVEDGTQPGSNESTPIYTRPHTGTPDICDVYAQ